MASSSSHTTNPFHQRPSGRVSSNSSSGSSSSSSYHHHQHTSSHRNWSHNNPADMPEPFTPEMRDRQARGKDPYLPEAADHGGDLGGGGGGGGRGNSLHHGGGTRMSSSSGGGVSRQQPKEPFQKTERRDWAETVLDNPELLLMYAQSSGDTLPATRHKFKRIMCGLDDYDVDDNDDDVSISSITGGGSAGQTYHHHQQQQRFNGLSWSNHSSDGGGGGGGSRGGRR